MYTNHFERLKVLVLVLFIFSMTSCSVTKPRILPDLSASEKLYREVANGDTANLADVPWRSLFTDKQLQLLIEEAVNNNLDLKIAEVRIRKTTANLRQSKAAFFPSVNAGVAANYQNAENDGSGLSENYQLYGNASWEADIWGKLRNMKKANLAAFMESDAYKRAVQTQLISDVANLYYSLLAFDDQLAITEKTLEKRKANVEAMKLLKDNDVITGADLVLSEANRYSAEVTIPDLKQSIYETENALSILLGRNPGRIERGSLAAQEITAELKHGVPAQLLANRPDVQEAEYRFLYYNHMTNVARTYFYPSLTITASGGISETDLSKFFDPAGLIWKVAGGLVQPILNQGINKQRLRVAEANEEENLVLFRKALLEAGEEVSNAMRQYQTASEKIAIRKNQVASLEKSVDFTMELLKYTSNTNYTDVLTAEVNLLTAQLNSVNDKLQQLQSVVYLYKSLGGGWK